VSTGAAISTAFVLVFFVVGAWVTLRALYRMLRRVTGRMVLRQDKRRQRGGKRAKGDTRAYYE
jgi:hypothetical protein